MISGRMVNVIRSDKDLVAWRCAKYVCKIKLPSVPVISIMSILEPSMVDSNRWDRSI